MSAYFAPRPPKPWQRTLKGETAPGILPQPVLQQVFAGGTPVVAGDVGLSGFKPDSNQDRKLIDVLLVGALTVFIHTTIIDRFQHPAPEPIAPPKETQVEITILKPPPPPPPPPPVVQPQPKPVPVKDAIPPKPKPKPKKIPPPVQRVEQPVPNVPVRDDAPPAPPVVQAAPPAPPPPKPKPVEKVVNVSNADYLRRPEPEYPEDAQERGWEGKVLVKAKILPSGKPDAVQLHKSSGHASLDAAAIKAVKASMFKPNTENDSATTVWAIIPITFQL